jgi:uncharacterized protein YutE (UPF0331/DUF86 family)
MFDQGTIEGILRNLDLYLTQLHGLAKFTQQDLEDDLVKQGAAKYYLQVSIECCIDLANHIIARHGFRAPESYTDTFTVLAENSIVDRDFLPTIHKMAKMRNRLVHLYWEVETPILYDVLQNNLIDFDQL